MVDMSSGAMVDLLTHDTPVEDFAISPDGNWVLVSTAPRLRGTAHKLWNMEERRVVLESGDVAGYTVASHNSPCVVMVTQRDASFKAPYFISVFHVMGCEFYEHVYSHSIDIVRAKPFMTDDDQYLVIRSAEQFEEATGTYKTPKICSFHVVNGMHMTSYDSSNLKFEEHMDDILEVMPCSMPQRGSVVGAIFSCRDKEIDDPPLTLPPQQPPRPVTLPHGFFLLDLSTGSLLLLCIPFPRPSYGVGISPLIFSRDCSLCLDQQSNIFHVPTGDFIGQVQFTVQPPRALALANRAVLYWSGSVLYAVRISDNRLLAQCEVHAPVCSLHVCSDEHTVLVGCEDGTAMSYTLVDPDAGNASKVLSKVGSRQVGCPELFDRSVSR